MLEGIYLSFYLLAEAKLLSGVVQSVSRICGTFVLLRLTSFISKLDFIIFGPTSKSLGVYLRKMLMRPVSQSLFVVGSQAHGEYSPVSRIFISSGVNSKSKMFAFSSMRDFVTDFGSVTKPF